MIRNDFLGQVAYETYVESVGGYSVHGDKLWPWDEMKERNPRAAEAWRVSAVKVYTHGYTDAGAFSYCLPDVTND